MAEQWDAAISFLDSDVDKARKIAELLNDRASVFVYANHPERLVGGDGVEKFSDIYGRDARLVVVLYRAAWGTTGWTGIEKTAINSRRVNERTDDFLMLVKMEDVPTPSWLPASRIWGAWRPLGAEGVAGAMVTRLQDLGTRIRPETPADIARRIADDKEWEAKRNQFTTGPMGHDTAKKETARVFDEMKRLAATAQCEFLSDQNSATVRREDIFSIVARTSVKYKPGLALTTWRGELWSANIHFGDELRRDTFALDLEPPDIVGWRKSDSLVFMTSEKVAETAVMDVLQRLERAPRR
jgi:hypothetical protein